jgi:hypothetical protein
MHLVRYGAVMDDIGSFFSGIFKGLQKDYQIPSACVRGLSTVDEYFDLLLEDITSIVTKIDLGYIFKAIEESQTFMGHLTETVSVCNFEELQLTI